MCCSSNLISCSRKLINCSMRRLYCSRKRLYCSRRRLCCSRKRVYCSRKRVYNSSHPEIQRRYFHITLGPRWVNGADSSLLKLSWLVPTASVLAVNGCIASLSPSGHLRQAVSASLRLVPASQLTTHDSLPAAWLHALSGQDFYLLGSFSEFLSNFVLFTCSSFLSVCVFLAQ